MRFPAMTAAHLIVGLLLTLAGLLWAIPAWLALSGGDAEAGERERLRRAALREWLRQGMDRGWANGPIGRTRPNRHDRVRGRRRGYTEGL